MPAHSEPVSPETDVHLCPKVEVDVSGSSGEVPDEDGTDAEEAKKQRRYRVDRDTEVTVETTEREREEHTDEEEVFERVAGAKAKKIPRGPTAEEQRLHRVTHCPFRSWCPKCVAGRGHQGGHFASEEPLDDTPIISIDYC